MPGDDGHVDPVPPSPVAAESAVSGHRARFDRAATWGVPAHVTVLYPFVAPPAITAATIAVLAGAVGTISAFDCEFSATAWFGEEVIWLAPRPDEPFRALTHAVSAALPGTCPMAACTTISVPISRSVTGHPVARGDEYWGSDESYHGNDTWHEAGPVHQGAQ